MLKGIGSVALAAALAATVIGCENNKNEDDVGTSGSGSMSHSSSSSGTMSGSGSSRSDSGYDTTGAVRSVLSIVQALGWRQVHDTLEVMGDVAEQHLAAAYELGATLAANVMADM